MPEKLYYGSTYHIYNRGVNRCNLFHEHENYLYFLKLFIKYIAPISEVYAYCLLPNHFHFLLHILSEDVILQRFPDTKCLPPSRIFSNFFNAYARAFNNRYGRSGSLFDRPFERKRVTNQRYFTTLIRYIHQNPQTHGIVADFRDWPYTSYDAILHDKPTRVLKTAVLDWFGGAAAFADAHLTMAETLRVFRNP